MKPADFPIEQTAIRTDLGAIFVSLELSTRTWLVSSIQPGRSKMSRHEVEAADGDYNLYRTLLAEAAAKAGAEIWGHCLMPNPVHVTIPAKSP